MIGMNPKYMLLIAFLLLLVGIVLPMLMTLQLLESTFFLNFLSFGASLVGLILGFLGAMSIAARNRNRRDH
jgi:hypothetical protein